MRPLRATDVEGLADLWVASWQEALPAIDFGARRPWIIAVLGEPAYATLVAERDEAAAGFATVESNYLHQLVVAPAAKGRGLATTLLAAVKGRAPDGLALDVNQANGRAVQFYKREGFRICGEGVNTASGLATWTMRWP